MPIVDRQSTSKLKVVKRHKKRRTAINDPLCSKNLAQLDRLEGLKKIKISPLAQKFVGCKVGENVTSEKCWILIPKEKFEDHLEFYERESDFWPIAEDIRNFPGQEILIGTHHYIQDVDVDFYVCTTLKVQKLIVEAVKNETQVIVDKIMNSLYRKCGVWKTLGSERQIECESIQNQRPLLIVDLIGHIPFLQQNTRFSLKNSENMRNGYMELITTRQTIDTVIRRRADMAVQVGALKKNVEVQVVNKIYCSKAFQSGVDYSHVIFSKAILNNLEKFVAEKLREISDMLKLNFSLNLYHDDYTCLVKNNLLHRWIDSVELKSYQDVINCRRRKITCFTLNAIISGYAAAAYARTPYFQVNKHALHNDEVEETVFRKHLILIWHYSDNVAPKLYLHASRDVTALSFCPYDAFILVAGFNNGQIAVWDLRFRLDREKRKEFLTEVQEQNRIKISEHTGWFTPPLGDHHVMPTLCSEIGVGHIGTVTTIEWIPPSKYISRHRVFENSLENEPHMQFITASSDGKVLLVWDLHVPSHEDYLRYKAKCIRLSTKPQALLTDISPLITLKNKFIPVCRFVISHYNYPIMRVLLNTKSYVYRAKNPETLHDINLKTYFRVAEKKGYFEYQQRLLYTTAAGTFHEATWECSDFDPKLIAIDEKCRIQTFSNIHDGPIVVCETNPSLDGVILTIGGNVFAIWYPRKIRLPIFWRKCRIRYVTGMWSRLHPLAFIVVRSDTFYEMWNILEKSEFPMKLFKYKGYKLLKLYKDTTRAHVRKRTCVLSESTGAFKLCTVPLEETSTDNDMGLAQKFLDHLVDIKRLNIDIKENFIKRFILTTPESDDSESEVAEPIVEKKPAKVIHLSNKEKWKIKLHQHMRKVLFEKKKLNLKELAQNKAKIVDILHEDNKKEKGFQEMKVKQEVFFTKARDVILEQKVTVKGRRFSFKGNANSLKERYYNDFITIEPKVLQIIKSKNYSFDYNWAEVLKRHKEKF